MVFQNYALWPHLSVLRMWRSGCERWDFGARLREEVTAALRLVRMEIAPTGGFRRFPADSSSGLRWRGRWLSVRGAACSDEPLSNLDARLRDAMRARLPGICRERGQTALYVTHDRQEALSMADRLAVLHSGRIRQLGTPRECTSVRRIGSALNFWEDVNFISGECESREFSMLRSECFSAAVGAGWERRRQSARSASVSHRPAIRKFRGGTRNTAAFSAQLRMALPAPPVRNADARIPSRDRHPGDRVALGFETRLSAVGKVRHSMW